MNVFTKKQVWLFDVALGEDRQVNEKELGKKMNRKTFKQSLSKRWVGDL